MQPIQKQPQEIMSEIKSDDYVSELNAKHFLEAAFKAKGAKRGFKSAKEWIENLILAEDLIEKNPAATLHFLAGVYGINLDCGQQSSAGRLAELCADIDAKINGLLYELNRLSENFEAKAKGEAELLAKAEEAKAAKKAAFAVSGHRGTDGDNTHLTTRQMLERQFAALNN